MSGKFSLRRHRRIRVIHLLHVVYFHVHEGFAVYLSGVSGRTTSGQFWSHRGGDLLDPVDTGRHDEAQAEAGW
jgi:hypothetical protein